MSPDDTPTVADWEVARIAKIIAPVFEANDWTWGGWGKRQAGVPTEGELALALRAHINRVKGPNDIHGSSSGRICVDAEWSGDGPGSEEPGEVVGLAISLHITTIFFDGEE